jgi:hypothetical protein
MNIELATVIADAKTRISAIESELDTFAAMNSHGGFVAIHDHDGLNPTGLRSLGGNKWNFAGDENSTTRFATETRARNVAASIMTQNKLDVMPTDEFLATQRDALVEMIAFLEKA